MSPKKTIQFYADLAITRNHVLMNVSNNETPSLGNVTIKCNERAKRVAFTTSARSYQNARQTGCPKCKAIKAKNQPKRVLSEKEQEEANMRKKLKRAQKRLARRSKRETFSELKNSPMLKEFLKKEDNVYTQWVLEKMEQPDSFVKNEGLFPKGKEQHHIIPVHAGGPDSKWNLIYLTKQDHIKAHTLRYEAYGEFGDYNFLKTQPGIVGVLVEPNEVFDQQIQTTRKSGGKSTSIPLDPELVGFADSIPVRVRTEQQQYSHQSKMSSSVSNTLYGGSQWIHEDSGITFNVLPEEAKTLTELLKIFINKLPEGHKDRVQLESVKKLSDYSSSLGKVIKTFDNQISDPKLKRYAIAGF